MLSDKELKNLLKNSKTIAVVGASRDPHKAAHIVPEYLKEKGYKIIPVNSFADKILGEKSYGSIADVKEKVDIIDIFRPGKDAYPIVRESLSLKPKAIWMQLGIQNIKAKELALKYNIKVIMNRCMMMEYKRLIESK